MRVYVESNFPLELARRQEEVGEAEEILQLAEAGRIELIFPVIAITEPFSTLLRDANERSRIQNTLNWQLRELARSGPNQPLAANMGAVVNALVALRKSETDLLEQVVGRMLAVGRSIPLTAGIFASAQAAEVQFDLAPQDAIVYASVATDLDAVAEPRPQSCFLSKNSNDFYITRDEFRNRNCNYIAKFKGGLAFIRAHI